MTFWLSLIRNVRAPQSALTLVTGVGILVAWRAGAETPDGPAWVWWLILALAFAGGAPIFAGAARGLIRGRSNVDELVTVAIVAALIGGEHLAAAVVAFMMNFGRMLEDLVEEVSGDAVARLIELVPQVARVKAEDGYSVIAAADVRKSDIVLVREGDGIAVDGTIETGAMTLDQSSITGESVPVFKSIGQTVFAGTVNVEGVAEIRATGTGGDTTLSRIVRLVESAKMRKAPVERVAERYARYFMPVILAVSALVFVVTRDWQRAIAVLIVACPCSLVMATPTAVAAGIARSALGGILARGGDVMEAVGKITTVALDKTGTITSGRLVVHRIIPLSDIPESEVLRLTASAETLSSHPLGTALIEHARAAGLELATPESFEALPGRGIVARVGNRTVSVGSHYLLQDPMTPATARPLVKDLRAEGLTCLTVGIDGRPAALLAMRDSVRPEIKGVVASLRGLGIRRFILLTGDNNEVANAIARDAGIDEVHAELLPADKLAYIADWQKGGERVLMVGDGVNDAPALAQADVGVAMGRYGTDVAIESSDVTLLSDDLSKLVGLIRMGRRTLSVIKFNLAFSVVLNVAAFVAAGVGDLSPIGAAILHNVGSVFVMVNAGLMTVRRL